MRPQTVHVSATPGNWEMERTGGVFTEQVIRPTGLIDPPVEIRPVSTDGASQVDDVIDEGKNGFGFDFGNDQSLRHAIRQVITLTDAEYQAMQCSAKTKFDTHFHSSLVLQRYIDELKSLTGI